MILTLLILVLWNVHIVLWNIRIVLWDMIQSIQRTLKGENVLPQTMIQFSVAFLRFG